MTQLESDLCRMDSLGVEILISFAHEVLWCCVSDK